MICETFKKIARQTWDKIDDARQVNFQLKEETLTDINLLELKIRHPTEIFTYEFTKHQEGHNGADWEWWFTDNLKWIGFRVQAKIINITSDEFEHLHYQNSSSSPQSEKLILQAENDSVPRIPLYCFYLSTEKLDNIQIETSLLKYFGCSLMSAYQVRTLRKSKVRHISQLQQYILPWHKLVCHTGNVSLVDHVISLIGKHFSDISVQRLQSIEIMSPPEYVLQILRSSGDSLQFNYAPKSLAGILIVARTKER